MKKLRSFFAILAACMGLALIGCGETASTTDPTPDDTPAEVTASFDQTSLDLGVGATGKIVATVSGEIKEGEEPAFRVSDEAVLTVKTGAEAGKYVAEIKALAPGAATVSLHVGEKELARCEVTVVESPLSIFLPEGILVLQKNARATVKAYCSEDLSDEFVWEVSDPSIATVEYQGSIARVTAHERGNCDLTVRCGKYAASIVVSVGK